MDGYHVSHDPAQPFTKEPTTGRPLNILDVPSGRSGAPPTSTLTKRHSAHPSTEIPKGRSLSPSKIIHPKPSKPYASRRVREADYSRSPEVDDLTSQLEQASLYKLRNVSPSSVGSSLSRSSRSSGGTSPSSLSSLSDPSSASGCRCNRYGVTKKGDRVKIDCGGSRCGYSDESSSGCSSTESDSDTPPEPTCQEIRPRQRDRPRPPVGRRRSPIGRRR